MNLNKSIRKIQFIPEFPKMIWLGENSLYEKAIFIRNYTQFNVMIDQLSYELNKRNYYQEIG